MLKISSILASWNEALIVRSVNNVAKAIQGELFSSADGMLTDLFIEARPRSFLANAYRVPI